ncbi:hypothetical protein OHC33_010293 [Knufia fluminis]|uniref:Methyltransferase domain-containing protein n=1 Tax=Knufia fluminis TaxID=191047 RepID=A0AAN8EFZ0_9EURO|nr:hypothetical protein OHC33_010293 [Knufia fluminis]
MSSRTTTQTPSLPTEQNPYLARAYATTSLSSTRALYDEWATKYDSDLPATEYQAPTLAADAIASIIGSSLPTSTILDAGCGTGLVGALLAERGAKTIDGVDLSPGMLDVARKTGAYTELNECDLSQPMTQSDESYDMIVCVGTLTRAHVGPEVLSEFVRVVKKGGLMVATVLGDIWVSGGYKARVDELREGGRVDVLSCETIGYRVKAGLGAKLVVMRRCE